MKGLWFVEYYSPTLRVMETSAGEELHSTLSEDEYRLVE
jgi:hypothetical protein